MATAFDENGWNILLVGGTDSGKRKITEAIFGNQRLQNDPRVCCEEICIKCSRSKRSSTNQLGTRITIVDTPGLLNTAKKKETYRLIVKQIRLNNERIAIFYTVDRNMTEGDNSQLNILLKNINSYTRTKLSLVLADFEDEENNQYTNVAIPLLRINSALQDREKDENQLKVTMKEIQLAKATVANHSRSFLSILNSATVLLIIVTMLSHSAQGNNTDSNPVIKWELMTKPVYFGRSIDLECTIKTEKYDVPKSWIRIPDGETIASDKVPTDVEKYGIVIQYDATAMIYKLTIKQFNPTDVNRVYRCDFGFNSYAEKLMLNDRDFISRPTEKDIKYNFSLVERNLIGTVKIENGYPKPFCSGIFEGINLSKAMIIDTTNSSIFFNTKIEVKYSTDICRGSVNVTCRYGEYELHIIQQVDVCSVPSKSSLSSVAVTIGILSVVIIAVAVAVAVAVAAPCLLNRRLKEKPESCFALFDGEPSANQRREKKPEDDILIGEKHA